MSQTDERRVTRTDLIYAAGLFLATVISRLPFRSQILYHWDSVNFAFAMQRFDVAADQPQSPGYILYVWLCRLLDPLFRDPQATMVGLSIAASGLAVVALYALGRAVSGRRTGLVAALLLAANPLFWFYGEIALPHALDTFLLILSVWLLYEVMAGRAWALLPAALSLALAGGVRQQTPVFLGLLVLLAGVRFVQRLGWRRALAWGVPALAVFGAVCAAWFFPLIASAGGLARYLRILSAFSHHFDASTSVFLGAGARGLARNLLKLGMYTAYGGCVALPIVALDGLVQLWRRQVRPDMQRALFLLAWVAPALLFYTLVHMGQQGLVFVFLPALLLVAAQALLRLLESRPRAWFNLATLGLVVLSALPFVVVPEYPLGGERFKVLSWDTLRRNDAYFAERFTAVRARFPASSSAIVAANWRHVQWYLPEYTYLPFGIVAKWEVGEGSAVDAGREERLLSLSDLRLRPDAQGRASIVLFDPSLRPFILDATPVSGLALPTSGELGYAPMGSDQRLAYTAQTFGILGVQGD